MFITKTMIDLWKQYSDISLAILEKEISRLSQEIKEEDNGHRET